MLVTLDVAVVFVYPQPHCMRAQILFLGAKEIKYFTVQYTLYISRRSQLNIRKRIFVFNSFFTSKRIVNLHCKLQSLEIDLFLIMRKFYNPFEQEFKYQRINFFHEKMCRQKRNSVISQTCGRETFREGQ